MKELMMNFYKPQMSIISNTSINQLEKQNMSLNDFHIDP